MAAQNYKVYLARFPFIEGAGQKLRPVIAVSKTYGKYDMAVVVPVSTRPELTVVDVQLTEWASAGLKVPSVARVHRLTAMLREDLLKELGKLSPLDARRLVDALRKLLEI